MEMQRLEPDSPIGYVLEADALIMLADIYDEQSLPRDAIGAIETGLHKYAGIIKRWPAESYIKGSAAIARFTLARLYLQAKRPVDAQKAHEDSINAYEELIRIKGITPDGVARADGWLNFGSLCEDAGELDLAREAFLKAQGAFAAINSVSPGMVSVWTGKGRAFLSLAEQSLGLGQCEEALSLLIEALDAYDQAVRCDPEDRVAWNGRGITLLRHGELLAAQAKHDLAIKRFDTSITAFHKAFEKSDTFIDARANLGNALCLRGLSCMKIGRRDAAIKNLRNADMVYSEVLRNAPGHKVALEGKSRMSTTMRMIHRRRRQKKR